MGTTFESESLKVELTGSLDWYRAVVAQKLADLSSIEARHVSTPSGVTLLGLVKHLAWAEALWFEHHLLGGPPPEDSGSASFEVLPSDTLEDVLAGYRATCDRSREIVAGAALDTPAVVPHDVYGTPSLRWILLHMIEETARHAGHADILRELTDGRTGD